MDSAAFNDAWLADLGAVVPERHGPQPAPPGPTAVRRGARPARFPVRRPSPATRHPSPAPAPATGDDVGGAARWQLHARPGDRGRGRRSAPPACSSGRARAAGRPAPCRDRRRPACARSRAGRSRSGSPCSASASSSPRSSPPKGRASATRPRSARRSSRRRPSCRPTRRRSRRAILDLRARIQAAEQAGRGVGGAGQRPQRPAPGRAHRGRADPAHRYRHRPPARGFARAGRPGGQQPRTCWSGHATCARSSRSCGPPARRPSRSTASG